jgi:hypothetical protein
MRSRVLMGEVVYAVQDAPLAAVGLSLVQKVSDTPWHLPALGLTEPLQPPAVGKLERVVVQRLQDEYRCVPVHPDSTVQYARPNRHRKKQLSWTVKPCVMLHYCRVASAWFMWWCAVCCVHASCVLHVTGSVGRDAAHASLRHTAAKERIAFVPSADLKYMPGLVEADEGVQQRPHVLHTHMHVVQRLHRCEERRIVDTPCPHARDDGGPLTHSFTPTSLRRTR